MFFYKLIAGKYVVVECVPGDVRNRIVAKFYNEKEAIIYINYRNGQTRYERDGTLQ